MVSCRVPVGRGSFAIVVGSPCSSQGGSLNRRVIVVIVEWASSS